MTKIKRPIKILALLAVGAVVLLMTACEKEKEEFAWVDLGLPSGLLWANCNVGANSPEEYGNYYAWGETAPKDVYNWGNYAHCRINGPGEFTKYCYNMTYGHNGYTDTLTVLQPVDDAATAFLGDGVRMPTHEEWKELDNECIKVWATKNGVKGYKFKGPNGNSLFLPAAGYCWDDTLCDAGSRGLYWSSSLWMDYPFNAWTYCFHSFVGMCYYDVNRSVGLSVRAVRARQN